MVEESLANIGATIMGRNMFGGHPGPWDAEKPWNGWWGDDPPFHHPVFVLTHHAREPLVLEGGTTFTSSPTASSQRSTRRARGRRRQGRLARGRRDAARQYLAAGLVDEMEISLVPIFLGDGERLFEHLGVGNPRLEHAATVAAPGVTHLKFTRR